MKRYFDYKKRECSNCGMLTTSEAFKYHDEKTCYVIAFKNEILKNEIENYGKFNNMGTGI